MNRRPIKLKRVYDQPCPEDGLRAFRRKYRAELARQPDVLHLLDDLRRRSPVTLLFGAHDEARNNAVVLREVLDNPGEPR